MNSGEQFETIVNQHYEGLYRFALSITRSESDAGDLVQHTFYVWATKGHQLRDISKVKTWLFTTLHRAFLETRRKQIRFPQCELTESEQELPFVTPDIINRLDCGQVLAALAEVDEVYRAAVSLFYIDGCPYKDIATILEIPVGTVKSRVYRGIEQLRKIFLSEGIRASARPTDKTSGIPRAEKVVEATGKTGIADCAQRRPGAGNPEPSYDDWDFGSTLLFGRLGIT
jgi:RNA polymerase sigma-70 factor (ECF subfamily)